MRCGRLTVLRRDQCKCWIVWRHRVSKSHAAATVAVKQISFDAINAYEGQHMRISRIQNTIDSNKIRLNAFEHHFSATQFLSLAPSAVQPEREKKLYAQIKIRFMTIEKPIGYLHYGHYI